jgi:dihydropyrimidinase
LNEFVALGSANHARMYGLYPRKGTIAIGADADIAIWNPTITKTIDYSMMHDAVGYTPYEGHTYTGWPETVLSRGRLVVADGQLHAARGSGEFLKRGISEPLTRSTQGAMSRKNFRSFIN